MSDESSIGSASMANKLMRSVVTAVETCSRKVRRAARRIRSTSAPILLRSRRSMIAIPCLGGGRKKVAERDMSFGGGDDVWRKAILMGEKCQPLDFSGVIYYDADGRRTAEAPAPGRSPMRSPAARRPSEF